MCTRTRSQSDCNVLKRRKFSSIVLINHHFHYTDNALMNAGPICDHEDIACFQHLAIMCVPPNCRPIHLNGAKITCICGYMAELCLWWSNGKKATYHFHCYLLEVLQNTKRAIEREKEKVAFVVHIHLLGTTELDSSHRTNLWARQIASIGCYTTLVLILAHRQTHTGTHMRARALQRTLNK